MVNAMDDGPSSRADSYTLMAPPSGPQQASKQTARATAEYENTSSKFRLEKRTFGNQYAQIYFFRLQRLKPYMQKKVAGQWPGVQVKGVLDLPENEEVVVIGTLYKEMKLKPSILAEYSKDRGLEQLIGKTKFSDPSDSLILEDESARVQLRGDALPVAELVTGVVAAVRGSAAASGEFLVTEILYPGMCPQPALPRATKGAKYVAFLSGLAVGEAAGDPAQLSLLVEFLTGMLGSGPDQATASKIVRTVVAGGLMCSNDALASATTHSSAAQQTAALGPIRELDMAMSELAAAMPVDVMPGATDPASRSMPQQPFHHCLFPGASAFKSLLRVTNPYQFEVDGVGFLGTSGQNVDDVLKYSTREEPLGVMEALLQWGHLVPTAPDTLSSYPFSMDDPFLLDSAPHVLFAGNQAAFATKMVQGGEGQKVRLLALPRFSETATLVLLDLATLDVHPITFNTSLC